MTNVQLSVVLDQWNGREAQGFGGISRRRSPDPRLSSLDKSSRIGGSGMAIRAAVALQKALSASLPTVRAPKTLQLLHFGQGGP